ncbi:MAG TPA: toll/interleukin-1 receptor domain-containing protein [Ktedonobacteraceae bacterium]|nr:toll/interleukin-1 receptor domain-containing protein [Ktedonobacteraceae bacterium]
MATKTAKVYISYARMDRAFVDQLKKHLRPLESRGLVELWSDLEVAPDGDWNETIDHHLNEADIILLMVSPDFLNSDYCYGKEMRRALERHEEGQARVIPIILRPVSWQDAPFSKFQVLPKDGKPVTRWINIDEALITIVEDLWEIIRVFLAPNDQNDHRLTPKDLREGEISLDLITAVITIAATALEVGATSGLTDAAKAALVDGYMHRLKPLLRRNFGAESGVMEAIDSLEAKPSSVGRQRTLQEELAAVNAQNDANVVQVAKQLQQTFNNYGIHLVLASNAFQTGLFQVAQGPQPFYGLPVYSPPPQAARINQIKWRVIIAVFLSALLVLASIAIFLLALSSNGQLMVDGQAIPVFVMIGVIALFIAGGLGITAFILLMVRMIRSR